MGLDMPILSPSLCESVQAFALTIHKGIHLVISSFEADARVHRQWLGCLTCSAQAPCSSIPPFHSCNSIYKRLLLLPIIVQLSSGEQAERKCSANNKIIILKGRVRGRTYPNRAPATGCRAISYRVST